MREHPCLYDTKGADYKVLLKKENAWKAIAAALGEHISGKLVVVMCLVISENSLYQFFKQSLCS